MNEPTGKKTPPLPLLSYSRGIKNKIINDLRAAKAADRNKSSNNDYDECDGKLHVEELKKIKSKYGNLKSQIFL